MNMVMLGLLSLGGLTIAAGSFVGGNTYARRSLPESAEEFEPDLDDYLREFEGEAELEGEGLAVSLPRAEVHSSMFGLIQEYRHKKKEKKMASAGYVKWFKVGEGGMMSRPVWVKASADGSGVPSYYDSDDEQTYLFPSDGVALDSRTGAAVAVHKKGEAEPINIQEPAYPTLDADRLQNVIDLEIESDPPGFFDNWNLSGSSILMLIVVGVLSFAVIQNFM